jgi:hypothetical protein
MSHYVIVQVKITRLDCLIEALENMGYRGKIEVHREPAVLIGYDGKPRIVNGRTAAAEVIIRKEHLWPAANDIGFARQPDGTYIAYISEYDMRVQPSWHRRLVQEYGAAVAARELRKKGWKVSREIVGDKIQLRAVRYA